MPDYAKLRQTTRRLIANSGVQCTLVKLSQQAGDSSEPWKGPSSARGDGNAVFTQANAVFVSLNEMMFGFMKMDESLLRKVERAVLVEPVDGVDFTEYHELYIGAHSTQADLPEERWKFELIQALAPDDTPVVYAGVLKR